MSRLGNRKALTLLEVLGVLFILGVLATLSWQAQKTLISRYHLQGAARVLVSDLRALHQRAIISRQKFQVEFISEDYRYVLQVREESGTTRMLNEVRLPAAVRYGFSEGVRGPPSSPRKIVQEDGITFRNNRMTFAPSGAAAAGTIYLTDFPRRAATRAVTVTPMGRVKLYRWTENGWR